MKKILLSWLLAVVLLLTVTSAFAEPIEFDNIVSKFLDETDLQTKDIALQLQSGDEIAELVIRPEGDDLHLVIRNDGTEIGHAQLNPTGIYVGSANAVTLLRYATVADVMQDIVKSVDDQLEKAVQSIPESEVPTEAEVKEAVEKASSEVFAAFAQEQSDATILSAAAVEFAGKFSPDYILDVKEEDGSVEINLRSEAYAAALAEAMDGLMSNTSLAELVDRKAAQQGGKTFAQYQERWAESREATLEAVRSIKDSEKLEENGHWTSHIQIGENTDEAKALTYDTDAWIDAENNEVEITVSLGLQDEEPIMVYEASVRPDFYEEKLTTGDSTADIAYTIDNNRISGGRVIAVLDGQEELRAEFGPDYLFAKGPKGSISTTVRETWSGKIRYELIGETAEGEEETLIVDFYQEDDSLVCELMLPEKFDQSLMFKVSRIDKTDMDDLSASENISEITADMIETVVKLF